VFNDLQFVKRRKSLCSFKTFIPLAIFPRINWQSLVILPATDGPHETATPGHFNNQQAMWYFRYPQRVYEDSSHLGCCIVFNGTSTYVSTFPVSLSAGSSSPSTECLTLEDKDTAILETPFAIQYDATSQQILIFESK